jgi:hypothetical protein
LSDGNHPVGNFMVSRIVQVMNMNQSGSAAVRLAVEVHIVLLEYIHVMIFIFGMADDG